MGSYAYILAAAFVLTGSVILLSQHQNTNRADVDLGLVQMKQEARDAAVSGLNVTIRKLADEQGPWDTPSDFEAPLYQFGDRGATYETVVTIVDTAAGDTVDVVSTGTKVYSTRNGKARDTTHVIEARIARGYIFGAIPPGFRSAIMSDNTMLVHGNFYVNALLPGVNADIHTNGVLDTRGNSFEIQGMGTYTNGERVSSQQEDNFVPDNDWNGSASNVFQRDSIPLPEWHENDFRTDAQTKGYYSTDPLVVLGSDLQTASPPVTTIDQFAEQILGLPPGDYGTEENPLLVMVDNSITFDGLIQLDGYVKFGSTGDIDVQTHSPNDGLFMSYELDEPNQIATTNADIFTTGDIRVEGNATIIATLYSEGSITYLGGTHLIGGQVAKETTFQGGGTVDIDWVGPGPGIGEYFDPYDEPIGPVIVAYAEW
ncbi:MAG: hypothetical protein WBW88_02600 [Rhodothermales bacterium]